MSALAPRYWLGHWTRDSQPAGSIDAVVLLLRYGADVNAWDANRWETPILRAVEKHHMETVRLLLATGADPNVRDAEDDSPLDHCVKNGLLEMARLLLRGGAVKTINQGGESAGMNALGLAATRLNGEMVKLLLAFGADPEVPDVDRMTTLDHLQWFPEYRFGPPTPETLARFHEICRLVGGECPAWAESPHEDGSTAAPPARVS